jgi:hypothetical protein
MSETPEWDEYCRKVSWHEMKFFLIVLLSLVAFATALGFVLSELADIFLR